MIAVFILLYLGLIVALAVGQAKVIMIAVRNRRAGIRRFTYQLNEHPIGFWTMLILETIGFLIVWVYLLVALSVLVS